MENNEYRYVETKFAEHKIYTFAMRVGDLLQIQYVASRGVSTEQGAVQRILNKSRVDAICKFVLGGNSFVNTFILNWTDTQYVPKVKNFRCKADSPKCWTGNIVSRVCRKL